VIFHGDKEILFMKKSLANIATLGLFCACITGFCAPSYSFGSSAKNFSQPFIDAAKSVQSSVVSIRSTTKKSPRNSPKNNAPPDFSSPEEFWDHFFNPYDREPVGVPRVVSGSGFVVSKDGHILTNNHNVEGADEITVILPGGREYAAKKIGGDLSTDIAVLQIDAKELPSVTFADSSTVEPGEWVLAVGNPFGFEASVTAGIISAKCRTDLDIVSVEKFFQTDTAINPGNSGGPLVNLDGHVVGMNTAIASNTGGYIGIGFAIQSNLLQDVMKELISSGHLTKGYLGVSLQKVTSDIAVAVGLPSPRGALISEVAPGGPADQAGIQSGDIILELQGLPVEGLGTLRNSIALMKPGEMITMTVRRNGSDITIKATISQHPENATPNKSVIETYGLSLEPITAETAKHYHLDSNTGLLVVEIDPASKAFMSGLRAGYVILAVNGKTVTTLEDFAKALQNAEKGGRVLLQIKVGTSLRFVPLIIE
jgi:serine protease Do